MVAKLFKIKCFVKNNPNNINKKRFFVYKDINNNMFKTDKYNMKKIIKFKVLYVSNNDNKKVLKNHKLVYDNNYDSNKNLEIVDKFKKVNAVKNILSKSIYRGVSKKGNKWQVSLFNNKFKYYLGYYNNENLAAKIYDYFAVLLKGKKAKTNFVYNTLII